MNHWTNVTALLMLGLLFSSLNLAAQDEPEIVLESLPLLGNGGFELESALLPMTPQQWLSASGEWQRDTETKLAGGASLRMDAKDIALETRSDPAELPEGLHRLSAIVMVRGTAEARASLRWWPSRATALAPEASPLREDALEAGADAE